jgi:hypothetical protein
MTGDAWAVGGKTAEETGIRLFPDPPPGFDPVRAAATELARYGYPPRPDASTQPQAYQRWQSVVSRPTTRIAPVFGHLPPLVPHSGLALPGTGGGIQPGQQDTSGNWAGRVAVIGVAETPTPIETIYGQWTVPRVLQPAGSSNYGVASWIGLDGGSSTDANLCQLIQAGTTVSNMPGHPQLAAWFEWLPADAVLIKNFDFESGDVIGCSIDVTGRDPEGFIDQVTVTLSNLTTGNSARFPQSRPTTWPDTFPSWPYTVPAPGYTANWILELPSPDPPANPPVELPQFASVYYDGCWTYADSPEGGPDAGNGDLLSMVGITNTVIAESVALNPALTDVAFRVDYKPPLPGL